MLSIRYPHMANKNSSFDDRLDFESAYFNILRGKETAEGFENEKPLFHVIDGVEKNKKRVAHFVAIKALWESPSKEMIQAFLKQFKNQRDMAVLYGDPPRGRPSWVWYKKHHIPYTYWISLCISLDIHVFTPSFPIEVVLPRRRQRAPKEELKFSIDDFLS